jgi:CubicO group peptidase (beta-lactamase class C family)
VAVLGADGSLLASRGRAAEPYRLASGAKLVTAYAVMIGVQEGAVALDDEAGPPSSTLRHLLAHTSGLGFDQGDPILSRPGERRIYSNAGIELAAQHLADRTGIAFSDYLYEAVLEPLGMRDTSLGGSVSHGIYSTLDDLVAFTRELLAPRLLDAASLAEMVAVQFPGVSGVVPGVGRFDPCDWGLGFERNFGRPRHWAGQSVSGRSFGHFGGAGTFVWVDPAAAVACLCLTDRPFDAWAMKVWPPLCDAVIAGFGTT